MSDPAHVDCNSGALPLAIARSAYGTQAQIVARKGSVVTITPQTIAERQGTTGIGVQSQLKIVKTSAMTRTCENQKARCGSRRRSGPAAPGSPRSRPSGPRRPGRAADRAGRRGTRRLKIDSGFPGPEQNSNESGARRGPGAPRSGRYLHYDLASRTRMHRKHVYRIRGCTARLTVRSHFQSSSLSMERCSAPLAACARSGWSE